nr:DUF3800 domain-containing protein [Leptospira alexanderi]
MNKVCYFDESGNSGLDFSKSGNSSHFILGGSNSKRFRLCIVTSFKRKNFC